jgi:hypothetical protein
MANSKDLGNNHAYATVDTRPSAGVGYWTDEIIPRDLVGAKKVFFSIREATAAPSDSEESVVAVRIQFQCPGDLDWTDYVPLDGSTFAIGNRVALEDMGASVKWRAGVQYVDYTSGSVVFGFDW